MDILTKDTVQLRAKATDKSDAIRQAGELLVGAGYVDPAYVDGMLAREEVMSTYLGNGVSIPHGREEDTALVQRTGISVLQLSDGIEWESGEIAHLVIGIAAKSDEHIGVLANLAEVIEDPEAAQELARTADPDFIVERLNR